MAQKSQSEGRIGQHTYQINEIRRGKNKPHEIMHWRKHTPLPARTTRFKGTSPGAPTIAPISTFNLTQRNAPIAYRRMTPEEKREQQVRNAVIGATGLGAGGAITQQQLEYYLGREKPAAADVPGAFRRLISQEIRPYMKPGQGKYTARLAANEPGLGEALVEVADMHPLYRKFKNPNVRYGLIEHFGDLRFGLSPKAIMRERRRGKIGLGIGAGLGLTAAGVKALRDRNKPLPYHAEYSTKGMKHMKTKLLH